VEALEASQITGVNKNTTQGIYSMIRRRVVGIEAVLSAGCGGVNESYFGPRKVCGIQGRGIGKLPPLVIGGSFFHRSTSKSIFFASSKVHLTGWRVAVP